MPSPPPYCQQQFVRAYPARRCVEYAEFGFDLGPGRFSCRGMKPAQNLQDRPRRRADEIKIFFHRRYTEWCNNLGRRDR